MNTLNKTLLALAVTASLAACGGGGGGGSSSNNTPAPDPDPVVVDPGNEWFEDETVVFSGPRNISGDQIFLNTYTQFAVADFNGDGFDDVLGVYPGSKNGPAGPHNKGDVEILIQDGAGGLINDTDNIINGPTPGIGFVRDITIADFNGDGFPDAFLGGSEEFSDDSSTWAGNDVLLLSDGTGKLDDASGNFAFTSLHSVNGDNQHYTHGQSAGDVDNDGDIDLLVNTTTGAGTVLMLNDGFGVFTEAASLMPTDTIFIPGPVVVKVGDLWSAFIDANDDGWLDIAIYSRNEFGAQNTHAIYLNDQTADFTTIPRIPLPAPIGDGRLEDDVITDINNDGLDDIIIHNFTAAANIEDEHRFFQAYISNGDGTFTDLTNAVLPNQVIIPGPGDIVNNNPVFYDIDMNGDGKLDLVQAAGDGFGATLQVFLDDGNGSFELFDIGSLENISQQIVPIDLGADGDIDIVTSSNGVTFYTAKKTLGQ